MKEKDIYLTLKEIDYLLKGMIHWEEIESRLNVPLRKPIEPAKTQALGKNEPPDRQTFSENRARKESILEDLLGEQPRTVEDPLTRINETAEKKIEVLSKPFLEGRSVYWVLAGIGILTLGIWAYFVFA